MGIVRNKTPASLPFTFEGGETNGSHSQVGARVETRVPVGAAHGAVTAQAIFREHAAFVLRVVRRLGVAPRDVEDVAQEVFVVVHRKLSTFTGESSVRTWLFGIASRVASDHRRRAYVQRENLEAEPPASSFEAPQTQELHDRELRRNLDRALDELDDAKRAVFVLYEMEGIPMTEIAESLGCPLPTAYSRLREARERIRASFARVYPREDTP
jgi:RNA polymerase sigma-70 factor (ECF subfamily)